MIIPKSFEIAGLTIEVIENNGSIAKDNFIGKADFSFQKIFMDLSTVPRQTTEQAFIHEIVHTVLYVQGEHKLRVDEKFVDTFAHLLYQVLVSGGMLKEEKEVAENSVYRIHAVAVRDGELSTYAFQGDDLKKVAKKAKRLMDIMQTNEPTMQVNFFAFESEWRDMIMPEDLQKELMDG
jgi:hypothetical protein